MTDDELLQRLASKDCTLGEAKQAAKRMRELIETNSQLVAHLNMANRDISILAIRCHTSEQAYAEWAAFQQGVLDAARQH